MQRWTDLADVPDGFGPSVVTIGNFDGVHNGHRAVLAEVVDHARARGVAAVAVTFTPHPVAVLYPERAPQPLLTARRRLDLLARTGIDAVLEMTFTRELATWGPERFVVDTFVRGLGAVEVIVGEDVRFGKDNAGDLTTMRDLGAAHGFDVVVTAEQHGTTTQRRWSSTWIRELLAAGDVEAAAAQLGRPHRVEGIVVHGDHRGRELGYPTANLGQVGVLVPADGVYAGWLVRDTGRLEGGESGSTGPADRADPDDQHVRVLPTAVSIGTNPTFDGDERRVEAHALLSHRGAPLDLYGEHVGVDLVSRLRSTVRFDSVESLVRQMGADVERTAELLLRSHDFGERPTW